MITQVHRRVGGDVARPYRCRKCHNTEVWEVTVTSGLGAFACGDGHVITVMLAAWRGR